MNTLLGVLLAVTIVSAKHVCVPGTLFKENCNTCVCSTDGNAMSCTDMMCPNEIDSKQVCAPKSQFKDYCNTCACSDDGLSYSCTRMYCDQEIWNKDGSLKVDIAAFNKIERKQRTACKPKSQFKNYCNTCACSDDGLSFSCTRMMCDKNIWNKDGSLKASVAAFDKIKPKQRTACKPKSQFKNYCNTCACSDDGLSYSCTRMMCDKNIWNKDGSLKAGVAAFNNIESRQHKACKPKSQFKNYCNTCACSDDGLSYSCTRMMCDKEVWNKDGSLKVVTLVY